MRASFPERDPVLSSKRASVIKELVLQEALHKKWIASSWALFQKEDLETVNALMIQLPKNSLKTLDLSELRHLPNLRSLTIYGVYWNWERVIWDWYVELLWLSQLSSLTYLSMNNFPILHLDGNNFPGNLQYLYLQAMGIQSFTNREALQKTPHFSVHVDIAWEHEPYSNSRE